MLKIPDIFFNYNKFFIWIWMGIQELKLITQFCEFIFNTPYLAPNAP